MKVNFYSLNFSVDLRYFIALVSLLNIVFFNIPLFLYVYNDIGLTSLFGFSVLFTVFFLLFSLTSIFLCLVSIVSVRLLKWFIGIFCFFNSLAIYFICNFQVFIDRSMIGNIENTSFIEAKSLIHPSIIPFVLVLSGIPIFLLVKIKLKPVNRIKLFIMSLSILCLSLIWVYMVSSTWLWFDRNAKFIGGRILPWSYIVNTIRYNSEKLKSNKEKILLPLGKHLAENETTVILVIGESARSDNFSLYGYSRETNPLLSKEDLIVVKNAVSCSTYTTASLLCLLSHLSQPINSLKNYEPLPSYLQRQGVDVLWRTNNWGEPKIKVKNYKKSKELRRNCQHNCRYDEVLLSGFKEEVAKGRGKDMLIVLHQTGSHGPDYTEKYPIAFEKFSPVCRTVELNRCSKEMLVNAYDNTIVYTDYLLSRIINDLKTFTDRRIMMMYISDHGESLGESGFYLHGSPYSIAPDVQKNIPFLLWLSPKLKEDYIDEHTFISRRNTHTQFEVFHTILGVYDQSSPVYDPDLDLLNVGQ
ncbi:Phosphoethanolamine transferase EptA [Thalassocella blandensis]|nr:Phosphoethanolamine transferase EptA [Thalassocella blandensis]